MSALRTDLARTFPKVAVSDDDADKVAYARDLWPRHHLDVRQGKVAEHRPGCIVWPETTDDVARLVRWAKARGTPLVPFGAGSGVCAGILPRQDAVVVDLKKMARWRALHREAPLLEVESGHMGVPLEDALNREGFTLGHFPSSILCSTAGGWVAARSAGQCSGHYGKIEDMVAEVEVVTGEGDVARVERRTSAPSLLPLIVGSEGTLGVITSCSFRLHPAPATRGFAAWSFPTTEHGWEAMREMFQRGLRPAVSRLYDPFDAMLARMGSVKSPARRAPKAESKTPGLGARALRTVLRAPGALNELVHSHAGGRALGGAMLVVIFEGDAERTGDGVSRARAICEGLGGRWEGEGPAQRWLQHRYSISYRQAPVFAMGAFSDTMEVAASWSRLGALYDGVRKALGKNVFVMAHMSHAYPDGCCIYFSFAGAAARDVERATGSWDEACEATYDRAWRAALAAAVDAGGTLAHHHGVGRSKAPRLGAELGAGVDVVRALMRALDPAGILNPGNLLPPTPTSTSTSTSTATSAPTSRLDLDRPSLLARVDASMRLADVEAVLRADGVTLGLEPNADLSPTVRAWLDAGAPGARDAWLDPVDQLLAGFEGTLRDGRPLSIRPAPRRAVGPDLSALVLACGGRFVTLSRAWLRVHRLDESRPSTAAFSWPRDPAPGDDERALFDRVARALAG